MADGRVIIDTRLNKKGLEHDVKSLTPVLKKLGGLLAAAFSVKALINFGQEAIELASDIEEVQNVVDTAFGDMAYKMEEFADTAIKTYGISKLTAKRTGSTLMAMASGMGIASEEASDMAIALTGLSADMSSFYNVTQDVAFTALKSVFTGETESLKQFGIVMTEANLEAFAMSQGIQKNIKDMTQAEKVQLRYAYVMQQTSLAQGDFAKTSNSWANQVRILKEQWKEFMSIIGTTLIQVLKPALQLLNRFVESLIKGATALANFFGIELKQSTVSGGGQAIEDMTDGMEDYTKATEKATKAQNELLGSYDKLNVITPKDTSSAAANAGATSNMPSWGTGTAANEMVKSSEKISKSLGLLSKIDLSKLAKSLEHIKDSLKSFGKNIGSGLKWLWDNVLVPLGKWTISDLLPTFLDLLASALDVLNAVIEKIKPVLKWLWNNFLEPIAKWTGGIIVKVLRDFADILKAISKNKTAVSVITGITTALLAYKAGGKMMTILTTLGTKLGQLGTLGKIGVTIAVAVTGWEIGQSLYEWLTGETIDQSITEQMAEIWEAVKSGEIWSALGLMVKDLWKQIKGLLENIKSAVINVFKNIWKGIKGVFDKTFVAFFKGIWNDVKLTYKDVKTFFTNAFETAKTSVQQLWSQVTTFFKNSYTTVKNVWSGAGQFFKNRWTDIQSAFTSAGTWISDKFKTAWTNVKNAFSPYNVKQHFSDVWAGIRYAFSNVSNWFKNTFSEAWQNVKDVFSKGGKVFDGIKQGILETLKIPINVIINGINKIIAIPFNALNSALNRIKRVRILGKTPFSGLPTITVPQIPRLTSGAVIPPNKEFLAVLGDQKRGTNIETPLATMVEAFNKALDARGGADTDKNINLYIDGDKLFSWTIKKNKEYKNRYGKPAY